MKKYVRCLSSALTLLLILNTTSYAWNGRGHRMVAAIAWEKLSKAKQKRVIELLMLNPQIKEFKQQIPAKADDATRNKVIFMVAATWPDMIKRGHGFKQDGSNSGNTPPPGTSAGQNIGYSDKNMHKYWHFKDVFFSDDGTSLPPIVEPNAQIQLEKFMAVLSSPTESDKRKSYDLSWLLHLVGDVHQPLHCVARVTKKDRDGDRGGNDVAVGADSLHAFWDDVLGAGVKFATIMDAIAKLPSSSEPSAIAANNLNVDDWIQESVDAANDTVYQPPIGKTLGPFKLNDTYRTNARVLAEIRVQLAGARLAKFINDKLQ